MSVSILKPQSEFADILRRDESYAVAGNDSMGNRINSWFDRLMLQSGADMSPTSLLMLSMMSAIAIGGGVFVWQENLLTTSLSTLLGALLPVGILMAVRGRRQNVMSKQLPPMIDELARAARSGRSLENALAMVAADTPAPLGKEIQHANHKLEMGLNIDEALRELPERTGLVSISVLRTALTVHRQSGGDLVHVLERLAQTLRDRLHYQGRLRAATAASRASAILMILIPPAALTFFVFRDPNYLQELGDSRWATAATVMGIVLELIGCVWVLRVLAQSKQS